MNTVCSTTVKTSILISLLLFFTSLGSLGAQTNPHADVISGEILETMNASGYTYVNIDSNDGPIWVAIPETSVTTGQDISLIPGMEMKDFHSNSLDRTFPTIFFSPGAIDAAAPPATQPIAEAKQPGNDSFAAAVAAEKQSGSAEPQAIQPSQGSAGSMGAIVPFQEMKIDKAAGENGYTVVELFEKGQELQGKTVRVRGQIVKFNANIMGKNWLHLQDGTGDPMQNSHDLVVTTAEEISGPKVITIEGTVVVDRDFGAGYKYAILVENGVIIE